MPQAAKYYVPPVIGGFDNLHYTIIDEYCKGAAG